MLFEDNHLLVVNKPPGVLMQNDTTKDESMLDLARSYIAEKYEKRGNVYLGLVHRIDRPCSGVVVIARTSKAAGRLGEAFATREVDKKYLCAVHGHVHRPGQCNTFLRSSGNDKGNKTKVFTAVPKGADHRQFQDARLAYTPLLTFQHSCKTEAIGSNSSSSCSLLEVDLYTGRKHQIRAQMSHLGHPVCGDVKYGAPAWPTLHQSLLNPANASPQQEGTGAPYNGLGVALHAYRLSLKHPTTKALMHFVAPLPHAWRLHFGAPLIAEFQSVLKTINPS